MNQSKTLRGIPWARFSFEAVLIIASILIAFTIDAWWDSRTDRKQERTLLAALSADFVEANRELSTVKSIHISVKQSSERILSYGKSGAVPDSERDEFDNALSYHFARYTYDPPMGSVESFLDSGGIGQISSQPLVAKLTLWPGVVSELRRLELEAIAHFYERLYPYLSSRVDLADLTSVNSRIWLEIPWPWESEPTNAYELVFDQEFLNIIYMHWVLSINILQKIGVVEKSLDEIQKLIAIEASK